jgi:hypothetical protein
MTLRKSESVLRLLVGLALGFGFVGFATHSGATQANQQQLGEQHASAAVHSEV